METAVLSAVLRTLGPKLYAFLREGHDLLRRDLELDVHYIRNELSMIAAAIEEHDRRWPLTGEVQSAWIHGARELAYDMEDCIDRFVVHRVAGHGALGSMGARAKFSAVIQELRKKSEELSRLRASYSSATAAAAAAGEPSCSGATASASETHTLASDIVGMDGPRGELLELIMEAQGQLKVISIVGFGGLGKTLLARQIYESDAVAARFQPRIWVRAAGKSAEDVLMEMLHQLGMPVHVHHHYDVNHLVANLRTCLESKRFFVVIDDMQREYWNSSLRNAFPSDMGLSSVVIVTTAIQSIANACSSRNSHVYVMRTLNEEHSRQLFLKEASWKDYPPGSEAILKICDGLPLALVTTAQFLQSKSQQQPLGCAKLCDNLGKHLVMEDTLARMKSVLVHHYSSLPGHVIKACLLYLGIFPSGRPVRRKTLIRRWSAEGFVGADHHRSSLDVAIDNFEELVNRSIIQPVDVSSNTEVKTCQTHGMMLEFILHKSICDNFITLLYGQARLPDKIRCVSIQQNSPSRSRVNSDIDLSLVRSLTIFGKAHKSFLNFSKYKLLRVLDLEECDELEDEHLKKICKLLLLKYLSLGCGITVLPKEIAELKFLETLDLRRTMIEFLPIQVLELPCLIHLFGVFKLQEADQQKKKLKCFLEDKSKLETLAGFVTDRCQIFPQLMKHMTNLAKVKIWCENTADASNSSSNSVVHLSKAIQEFIKRGTDVNHVRSLSLDFGECSQEFLNFPVGDSCYLSSLKLKGNKICRLPPFITSLAVLTELCLSSSDELSSDVLAALTNVRAIHYLKLIAHRLDTFVIERGDLRSLRRLHIVVVTMTQQPQIQEGALPNLESIHLLCRDLDDPCGRIRIECLGLGCLKEVALDDGVHEATKELWKDAARRHPKRPKVVFVGTGYVDRRRMGGAAAPAVENNSAAAPVAAADVKRRAREESEISVALASLPAKMARLLGAANIHQQTSGTQGELSCGGNGALQRHFS